MRNTYYCFLISLLASPVLAFVNPSNAQDVSTAVGYMEYIFKEFKSISSDTWDYTSAVAHGKSARKVEKRRKEIIATVGDAITKLNKLKPFEGDASLRDSALSYLNINMAVLKVDYAKIVDMEEISEQSYDLMEAYMLAREKANEKLSEAGDRLEEEQKKFAAKHSIKLLDANDKITLKLKEANNVYKYYNELFLIYFKSYKQEAYLLEAMQKNDVNAFEQNRSALSKTSQEGIGKLASIKPFKGDASIKTACQQVLQFLKDEADKKLVATGNFYVKRDNFEKIKTSFEAKSEKQRTQKDVTEYNNAGKEYNTAVNDFNKMNAELNQKRNQLIENWNQSVTAFTDKHVPKKK